MATPRRNTRKGSGNKANAADAVDPDKALSPAALDAIEANTARIESAEKDAQSLLRGDNDELEVQDISHTRSLVRTVTNRVNRTLDSLSGGATLETMARLKQDALLNSEVPANVGMRTSKNSNTLRSALENVEAASIGEMFQIEKSRTDDYMTFTQIAELITQAGEAIQTYVDNIMSPDDFTKNDLDIFYEGSSVNYAGRDGIVGSQDDVRTKCRELIERYRGDEKIEKAIAHSLTKGDYFISVLNLRHELEKALSESVDVDAEKDSLLVEAADVVSIDDKLLTSLQESFNLDLGEGEPKIVLNEKTRQEVAEFINDTVIIREDSASLAAEAIFDMRRAMDIQKTGKISSGTKSGNGNLQSVDGMKVTSKDSDKEGALEKSSIRGSVVRSHMPENVIKLYRNETVFGYYVVETDSDFAEVIRRGSMDQTSLVRAIDQSMSARTLGSQAGMMLKGKDALISRLIIRTLANKLGNAKFLIDNEQFARDAYEALSQARKEDKRVIFSFVPADQMVHFTPDGASGYGTSVLARVKFLAKLYLGAMTNAFMRNAIRRSEYLVWYIDVGLDNDASNAVQNHLRTVKQKEVKFSNLKDITTTMNQVGQFHDFHIPTYNGERPIEVETLNMPGADEVDSPYLEFLRKGIIGGAGVPAAFLGYSEEVQFAKSLTMENGRFLRRVVRHQKHYGRSATQFIRMLWANEYKDLVTADEAERQKKDQETKAKENQNSKSKEKFASSEELTSDEQEVSSQINHEIDPNLIYVRFPSPATLNMTNIADALNQAQGIIDTISTLMTSSEESEIQDDFKLRVAKKILPQIDWDDYGELLVQAKASGQRKRVTSGKAGTGDGSSTGE